MWFWLLFFFHLKQTKHFEYLENQLFPWLKPENYNIHVIRDLRHNDLIGLF